MIDSNHDGVYEVTVSSGENHKNVIIVRMNPASNALDWNNKWAQTADLDFDGTNNCYKVVG